MFDFFAEYHSGHTRGTWSVIGMAFAKRRARDAIDKVIPYDILQSFVNDYNGQRNSDKKTTGKKIHGKLEK